MIRRIALTVTLSLALALASFAARAQGGPIPGQRTVPQWYCQLSATQLASSVGLASCTAASFTGSGSGTTLTASSVSGYIQAGQAVSGTGVPAGTTIVAQLTGTAGGAGTYQTSQATTSSSNSLTSGGVPPNATGALIQAETANVRWRDDGGAPTASIGMILGSSAAPMLYTGNLGAIRFILATGSPLVDVAFYQ